MLNTSDDKHNRDVYVHWELHIVDPENGRPAFDWWVDTYDSTGHYYDIGELRNTPHADLAASLAASNYEPERVTDVQFIAFGLQLTVSVCVALRAKEAKEAPR